MILIKCPLVLLPLILQFWCLSCEPFPPVSRRICDILNRHAISTYHNESTENLSLECRGFRCLLCVWVKHLASVQRVPDTNCPDNAGFLGTDGRRKYSCVIDWNSEEIIHHEGEGDYFCAPSCDIERFRNATSLAKIFVDRGGSWPVIQNFPTPSSQSSDSRPSLTHTLLPVLPVLKDENTDDLHNRTLHDESRNADRLGRIEIILYIITGIIVLVVLVGVILGVRYWRNRKRHLSYQKTSTQSGNTTFTEDD